jgi:CBS domain-containing protein
MHPALAVDAGTPLSEVRRRVQASGREAVVVLDPAGRPVGVVDDAAVAAVPAERWPWLDVSAVSRRIEPAQVLPVELSGDALVSAINSAPAGGYPVIASGGLVLGVLLTVDVERALASR